MEGRSAEYGGLRARIWSPLLSDREVAHTLQVHHVGRPGRLFSEGCSESAPRDPVDAVAPPMLVLEVLSDQRLDGAGEGQGNRGRAED